MFEYNSVLTSQPQGQVEIDRNNPLAKGLISVADARGYDSITGAGTLYNGSAISRIPTKKGVAVNFDQNQLDFKCGQYANTNQTHLVIADIASGTWKVAAFNHGMVLRLFNNVIVVATKNYGNQFNSSLWTGLQTIVHRVGNSEHYDQEMFIDGVKSSWVASVGAETLTNGAIVTLGGSYIGDRFAATWWGKPVMLSIRWNRALTDGEIASISANPWQLFNPRRFPVGATVVTAQFLRPIADISNSGWTPSTGASLAACIGEAVRDDATYISATAPGAICEVLLGTSSGDPLSSINHLPRIVMSAGSGGIILRLKQGATVIKAWTYASLPLTDTLHEPTLTSGEIDAISDYTDLRLEMETTP